MKLIVITQTDGVIIMIPVGAVGVTELEGVMISVLPDDVDILVELVGSGILPLENLPVVMEEVAENTALLETI